MTGNFNRFAPAAGRHHAAARRAVLFSETAFERVNRLAAGLAWELKSGAFWERFPAPRRWRSSRRGTDGLPDPACTLNEVGLAGLVHDLSPASLIEAYRRGLCFSGHFAPLIWMSPPQRCVLFFKDFHIGKDARRLMRKGQYRFSFDRDFESVIKACAGRRNRRWHLTWIAPAIMRAFADLHDAGYAHSYEVWNEEGALVGGGYGVALGQVFFGESQFSHERNASKFGQALLMWHLDRWGFICADAKGENAPLISAGFRNISRADFLACLNAGLRFNREPGPWTAEGDADLLAAWARDLNAAAGEDKASGPSLEQSYEKAVGVGAARGHQ